MKPTHEKVLSWTLSLTSLVIAVSVGYRVFNPHPPKSKPKYILTPGWKDVLAYGTSWSGAPDAPVQVLLLSDYECPACSHFFTVTSSLFEARSGVARLVYLHYPISYHKHAAQAALASECMAAIGMFRQWTAVAFAKQDSFGTKSLGSFFAEAGARDTAMLIKCVNDKTYQEKIDSTVAFGDRIKMTGTPTIVINGILLRDVPSVLSLDSAIRNAQAGRWPPRGR